MCLLLAGMPLDRVAHVWSQKAGLHKLPTSCFPMKFHRSYAPEIHAALGENPSLERWREVFEKFLRRKIPVNKPNEFKWKLMRGYSCLMTQEEIAAVASECTYQYALERL